MLLGLFESQRGNDATAETLQVSKTLPAGRLRLVRQASDVHCLYANAGSSEFRLVHSLTVGTAAIKSLAIEAKSSDDVGLTDVTLEKMAIRVPKK